MNKVCLSLRRIPTHNLLNGDPDRNTRYCIILSDIRLLCNRFNYVSFNLCNLNMQDVIRHHIPLNW